MDVDINVTLILHWATLNAKTFREKLYRVTHDAGQLLTQRIVAATCCKFLNRVQIHATLLRTVF